MTYRMIQVGTGGRGGYWCSDILPPCIERGLVEPVAAVDVDPDALSNATEHLGLDESDCYTDAAAAFAAHPEADFCTVVVPPWAHEDVVDAALEHDMHVLSEKPIADTLDASVRIAEKVDRAGVKMGVTMSHRFDRDKTTLRRRIRSGEYGPLDYLAARFTCAKRQYGSWGAFRHDMPDPLLVEGAVHQLDFLADMAGERVATLYADTWRPEWAEYDGDCQALVEMRMENGRRITWEGAKANAVTLNGWGEDYVRAECRDATLVLDARELEYVPYEGDDVRAHEGEGTSMPLDERESWSDGWLVEQFVEWLDGGPAMETRVAENIQSVALVEAAIRSSQREEVVDVQDLLAETREAVEIDE
ncbi:gfo/Idh/MocA family oxidoreductase [Halobacteriales archaeon QS_5_68_33]|jgi:predicted dehydrogenase|nr:MAG: gfo/Idh/MocA family oxidoreductase [Halobacteriales archaeon QS_5_68_33]